MLLLVTCAFLLATPAFTLPLAEDQYFDELLRQEQAQYNQHRNQLRQERNDLGQQESFGQQYSDSDEYGQTTDDQQKAGHIEQLDQDEDQQQSGGIEQYNNENQQQNNGIEQFDEDQESREPLEKFNNNDNGEIEQFEQNQGSGLEGDSNNNDQFGQSNEQDKIEKAAIDQLYSDNNREQFVANDKYDDIFGSGTVADNQYQPNEIVPTTKKPSWFHRAWNKTKEKVKGAYHSIKATVG